MIPAQSTPSSKRAVRTFEEAEQLLAAGKVGQACPLYEESYRLEPKLGVLLYLADCREQNGQLSSAYRRFQEARDLAKRQSDKREQLAAERLAALAPRVSQVRFVFGGEPVRGFLISHNGRPLPPEEWDDPLLVDQGKHRIEVSAPGYQPWISETEVAGEGQRFEIIIPPLALQEAEAASATAAPQPRASLSPRSQEREQRDADRRTADKLGNQSSSARELAMWSLGSLGVAGLGTAGVLTLMASDRYDDSEPYCNLSTDACSERGQGIRADAGDLALGATIAGSIGAAALAGALVLWLVPDAEPVSDARFGIDFRSDGAQLTLVGGF